MPPLRARPDDLIRLATHYLKYFSAQCGRGQLGFSKSASSHMLAYSWPGNLRELRNAIERAAILAKNEQVDTGDLPGDLNGSMKSKEAEILPGAMISLEQLEELHMKRILERTNSVTEAARVLGIDQATIYRKRKKMGMT
jgi:NtrC-family two-component system response regulator AlgB